jgi:release factor glutamine methyltransferase
VFAEDEAGLLVAAASDADDLAAMVERRAAGVPIEQVVGWAEFCGLRIAVEPGVFVPRRRSELLVREAVARASHGAVVVDMCCGTGAIGAAVAAAIERSAIERSSVERSSIERSVIELHAVDVDPVATRCARRNLAPFGGHVYEGDLFRALPVGLRGRVDIVVANAPYVPTDGIDLLPAEAREYEPRVALDGGADGLDTQRAVVADAPSWLVPGGRLLIETTRRDALALARVFAESRLRPRVVSSATFGAAVVVGTAVSRAARPARR